MFEWEAFLDVARELARQTDNEAAQRSAISRAYCAVLGLAHEQVIEAGWTLPRGSIHHHVWRAYGDAPDQRRKDISDLGFFLRNRRNEADYRRQYPYPLSRTVSRAIQSAETAIALLHAINAHGATPLPWRQTPNSA